jgi:hypothetical protein
MGPPSYMRSVFDRNVVMQRIPVYRMGEAAIPLQYSVKQNFLT